MAETLCAILTENFGASDWFHTAVISPYYRASDASHWDLCYLRDEDVDSDWDDAYADPDTGLITAADPGGNAVAVKLKVKVDGILADQNPEGRVTGIVSE